MIINTLHKTFNKQTDYIGKGNVYTNTQVSSFIRAYNTREHAPRIDRDFDLQTFSNIDIMLKRKIIELTEKETVILYKFRHWDKTKEVIHGYIITSVLVNCFLHITIAMGLNLNLLWMKLKRLFVYRRILWKNTKKQI